MRTIVVMNQKGGVGKTTTSVNVAAGLAARGRRVCLIDLDPQGHASMHLGIEATHSMPTIYDVFAGEKSITKVRHLVAPNLWVVPSNLELAAVEMELADVTNRELILRAALQEYTQVEPLDYVFIDCPPSLGVLTINALSAAREVFIPLQPHFFALQGLSKLLETTARVTRRLNRELKVSAIVICLFETGTRLAGDVIADLSSFLKNSDPQTPWANARIFQTKVRRNIKLAEAPSFGQSIFDYEPKSAGAQDYSAIVEETIAMESVQSGANAA
jgi:chromosome partitioning protein